MPYTRDVFGMSAEILEYSYIDRANLDKRISKLLLRDTHIALKGASKSGKTWLRKKCIQDAIVVQCRLGMTVADIYKAALSSIGVAFDTSTTKSHTTTGGLDSTVEVKVPFLAKAELDGSVGVESGKTITSNDFHRSASNLEFVANAIKQTKNG